MYKIIIPIIITLLSLIVTITFKITNKKDFTKYLKLTTILAIVSTLNLTIYSCNLYIDHYFKTKIANEIKISSKYSNKNNFTYENSNGINNNDFNIDDQYLKFYYKDGQNIKIIVSDINVNRHIFFTKSEAYTLNASYNMDYSSNYENYNVYLKLKEKNNFDANNDIRDVYNIVYNYSIDNKINKNNDNNWKYIDDFNIEPYSKKSVELLNNNFVPSYFYINGNYVYKEKFKFTNPELVVKFIVNGTIVYRNMDGDEKCY